MKKQSKKINLSNFEIMSDDGNGTLVGGFSKAKETMIIHNVAGTNRECHITNNCNGGNCVAGCGGAPK
jgi:hypothetical protein